MYVQADVYFCSSYDKTFRYFREVGNIIVLIGKAVENLLEGLTPGVQAEPDMLARYRDANLLVLKVSPYYTDLKAYSIPSSLGRFKL